MSNIDINGKKIRKDEEISVIFSSAHRFHSRLRNFYDLNWNFSPKAKNCDFHSYLGAENFQRTQEREKPNCETNLN